MNFRNFLITLMIGILFLYLMLGFVYQSQTNNGVNNTIFGDPLLEGVNESLYGNLSVFSAQAEEQRNNFESGNVIVDFGELVFKQIVGAGQSFTSTLVAAVGIFHTLGRNVLGIPEIVFGTLTGIALFTIIFLLWRVYRAGD